MAGVEALGLSARRRGAEPDHPLLHVAAHGRVRARKCPTHFGQGIFESFGTIYAPMLERMATLLVFWLILFWMYRRKIFLRL